jgi:hypothetical protein
VSQLWNSLDRRYEDAAAVFAAHGRLIEADGGDAIILVNGQEEIVTPATLVTAAMMMDVEAVEEHGPEYCESCGGCKCHCDEPGGDVDEASAMLEVDSTTSGEEEPIQIQERTRNMNFHNCSVTQKYTWAGADGYCKHCRPVETVHTPEGEIELTPEDVAVMNAPMLADLIEEVGGETALLVSIEAIRRAKLARRRGDSVNGRRTRELLNLIMQQPQGYQGALLNEYREFLAPYGIGLNVDVDGVCFHDYSALTQPVLSGLEDTVLSDDQRPYAWQANVAEKRAMRNAFVETVRTARNIVMSWVSSDGTESGSAMLGPNTEETRLMAAEYQAAARRKGYRTRFTLVQA